MITATWRVAWSSPYTNPPDGMPRDLATLDVPDWPSAEHHIPEALHQLAAEHPGYGLHWGSLSDQPRRTWSRETRARNRKRKLRERLQKKYPMLWEQFYAEQVAANPDYYEACDAVYDAGRQERIL